MIAGCLPHYTQLLEEAVNFSADHVHDDGLPFTAFVVNQKGIILGRGVNRVRKHNDPISHAEVEAIRDACQTHDTTHLSGATLLASGEPCAMCYMIARYAGISQIYFAADRDETAAHGFDYREAYRLFTEDPLTWRSPSAHKLEVSERLRPFQTFHSKLSKP